MFRCYDAAPLRKLDMAREAGVTSIERAFELARSGVVRDVQELRQRLNSEGYNRYEIEGRTLYAQLRTLIEAALNSEKVLSASITSEDPVS